MKFTRKHELYLIELGLQSLLDTLVKPKSIKKSGKKWTNAQRKKFKATMQRKFAKDNTK